MDFNLNLFNILKGNETEKLICYKIGLKKTINIFDVIVTTTKGRGKSMIIKIMKRQSQKDKISKTVYIFISLKIRC